MKTMTAFHTTALVMAFGTSLCFGAPPENAGPPEIIVHPRNAAHGFSPTAGSTSKVSPSIAYHGGPVMGGTPSVYVIWYGAWTAGQKLIVTDFLNAVGGSPYFNINTTYPGISGLVSYAGATTVALLPGNPTLADQDIQNIVANSGLPSNPNGVYFVLTGSDVKKSGFCTSYCGWHSSATLR